MIIGVVSENLESARIGVTLEQTHETNQSQYSHSVSISPNALGQTFSEREIQLTVSYDTLYNVSILAITQCGQRIATTLFELYYGMYTIT